jgi:hypothetical protein
MNTYYVSLTGPLLGIFLPVVAADENTVRLIMNHSKLKQLWCSVYPLNEAEEQVNRYGGFILGEGAWSRLDFDYQAVMKEGGLL